MTDKLFSSGLVNNKKDSPLKKFEKMLEFRTDDLKSIKKLLRKGKACQHKDNAPHDSHDHDSLSEGSRISHSST